MEHELFCIIKHALHAFILMKGYSFIHYSIKIYWVPPRYYIHIGAVELESRIYPQKMVYSTNKNKP